MSGNKRTVVLLEEGERGGLRVKLVSWPRGEAGPSRPFKVPELPELQSAEDVAAYGKALLSELRRQRVLRKAVDEALKAVDDDVRPLCFKTEGRSSDTLYWETLWEQSRRFLALNPNWPIGRVVDSASGSARVYRPPLRVLAVMSAIGIEARAEWLGLQQAVEHARQRGLPVEVTALVGEQALFDDLSKQARTDTWLHVSALRDKQDLLRVLSLSPPHLVHLFCHAWVGLGEGQLDFATIGDWAETEDERRDSIRVPLNELRTYVSSRRLWLMTLNCCNGGRPLDDAHSLAQNMVEAGAAAALGWRQPVDARDANTLCRALYLSVFNHLADRLVGVTPGSLVDLELAGTTYDPRESLFSTYADDPVAHGTWTLPVLYLARDPMQVFVMSEEDSSGDAADVASPPPGAAGPGAEAPAAAGADVAEDSPETRPPAWEEPGAEEQVTRSATKAAVLADMDELLSADAPAPLRAALQALIQAATHRAATEAADEEAS